MKKHFLTVLTCVTSIFASAQNINQIINAVEVERIEKILASDDMKGRETFTPDIDRAADFIASEFAKSKLDFFGNATSYFQEFGMIKTNPVEISGMLDKDILTIKNVIANTTHETLDITSLKDYEITTVNKGANLSSGIVNALESNKNTITIIDISFAKYFLNISQFVSQAKVPTQLSQIFIISSNFNPSAIDLHIKNEVITQKLKNVVGVLPGKSKKDEYVVFAGHYDHLGIQHPETAGGDSIFNGANDDASGTTAVMMLAKYFSEQKDNERTLIFVAFTAEEIGGYGSKYFSKQVNPDKVMAMFNIEMIGTESKWGKNSAFITGYEKSNMGKILQANLKASKFRFEPDPYPKQELFYRSDNAKLAEVGVPAHTISTSKMDEAPNNEPNYHQVTDEIGTLDMNNMSEIIKSIAISSKTIISGKDTPSRLEKIK